MIVEYHLWMESKYTIGKDKQSDMGFGTKKIGNVSKAQGRFPANLLCSDDVLNDGVISKSNGNDRNNKNAKIAWGFKPIKIENNIPDDQGTNSRYYDIDKWFDKIIHELL